jgi:cbb3-type cytochrome oxidase subunit 3
MENFWKGVLTVFCIIFFLAFIYFAFIPSGRSLFNEYTHSLHKADENQYEKRKAVEDTCRSMISSYNADKLIYEQYKDSTVAEEISWANNAKIRANQTASTYNNYILKNSYIWENNVPSDIYMTLSYIN